MINVVIFTSPKTKEYFFSTDPGQHFKGKIEIPKHFVPISFQTDNVVADIDKNVNTYCSGFALINNPDPDFEPWYSLAA